MNSAAQKGVAYNGRIFCLREDGDTYVVEAGAQFKIVGTNRLEELCLALPAVADGKLLMRTASRLYSVARRGSRFPMGSAFRGQSPAAPPLL